MAANKYELVRQKYTDSANKSWAAEYADTIEEETMGEYPTVGMAATFRSFLIKEKKYSDEPTGLSSSTAFYIREKVEQVPASDPVKKPQHGAVLQFQGHSFEMSAGKAMELKALLEALVPDATVLVSPSETTEVVGEEMTNG